MHALATQLGTSKKEHMFLNNTRNQHYVSQAEQRLNAMNPCAAPRNQRILTFDVSDRDAPVPALNLLDPRGAKIEGNMTCLDLFSFEVVDSHHRMNLEQNFGKYEEEVAAKSRTLIDKLRAQSGDVKAEIIDVFAIKLLNFFRNPYCVRKPMNTFGAAANYEPRDPEMKSAYRAILNGSRPHAATVCQTFDLTGELYEGWLRALFIILSPVAPMNIFEATIKGLFEESRVTVGIFDYTRSDASDTCLLSDRGFNVLEQSECSFAFEFNLCSHAFAVFHLTNLSEYSLPADLKGKMKGHVDVTYFANDRRHLAQYNMRTAYQCASQVFAATSTPRMMP